MLKAPALGKGKGREAEERTCGCEVRYAIDNPPQMYPNISRKACVITHDVTLCCPPLIGSFHLSNWSSETSPQEVLRIQVRLVWDTYVLTKSGVEPLVYISARPRTLSPRFNFGSSLFLFFFFIEEDRWPPLQSSGEEDHRFPPPYTKCYQQKTRNFWNLLTYS